MHFDHLLYPLEVTLKVHQNRKETTPSSHIYVHLRITFSIHRYQIPDSPSRTKRIKNENRNEHELSTTLR